MYENQTKEAILQRMLDRVDPELDKREGSVVFDMLSPSSYEFANFYALLDEVLKLGFAPTSSDEFLEMRCAELGVYRKQGTYGIGELTFIGDPIVDEGKVIPEGTTTTTGGNVPIYFITTEEAVMTDGVAKAMAQCEVPGLFGNVRAGDISLVVGDMANLFSVSNLTDFHSGSDDELDEDLFTRYNDLLSRPITSGNENHYLLWARSVNGIGDARVRSNHTDVNTPVGTVEVILLDATKMPTSVQLNAAVYDYIESVRPIGATVVVRSADALLIDVSVSLVTVGGADVVAIEAQINDSLASYLKDLAFKDDVVRYSRIANLFLEIEGVLDYSDFTLNGGSSNITTNYTTVAIKGDVVIL